MSRISIEGYEPAHLSWSTYDSYATCGERQRLQKVLKKEQRPNWGSVGGSAVHDSIEVIELTGADVVDLVELFNDKFDQAIADTLGRSPSYTTDDFYVSGRGKKNEAWWREEGPRMVQRWIDWRAATGWTLWHTPSGVPAVELEMNFSLPGDIPVKAFIDSVFQLPSGVLAVVDVKSGRIPETGGQLGMYAVGLETLFGVRAQWGYYWDAAKGTHGQPIPLGQYTADHLGNLLGMAIAGHNAGVFLPKPQMNCASWCGVAKYCAAVGGELAHEAPSF